MKSNGDDNPADLSYSQNQELESVQIVLELPGEMLDQIERVAADNGWPEGEAIVTVLAYGLNYLKGENDMRALVSQPGKPGELEQIMDEITRLRSAYAVMKYRAFNLMKDNQTLDIRQKPLLIENEALRATVWRLREENSSLKQNRLIEVGESQPVSDTISSEAQACWPQGVLSIARGFWRKIGLR